MAAQWYTDKKTVGGILAVLFILYLSYDRFTKSNRIENLVNQDITKIHDNIYEKGLQNNGYYNGCLKDDETLHNLFKLSFKKNETIDELRYRLLKWSSSKFGKYYLVSEHLIRKNGTLRDTPEEIANAIASTKTWLGMFSRGIGSLFSTRRRSSASYLQNRKTSTRKKTHLNSTLKSFSKKRSLSKLHNARKSRSNKQKRH